MDQGTFSQVVSRLNAAQRRECAREFEVAVTTVDRWAKKTANPHPLLRKQIVEWVMRCHAN